MLPSVLLKELIQITIHEVFISESKQTVMNLGYPEVIASLLSEKYGKADFLIAKWMRETFSYKATYGQEDKSVIPSNWFEKAFSSWSPREYEMDVVTLVKIYEAAKKGEEEYRKTMDQLGYKNVDDEPFDQSEKLKHIKARINFEFLEKEYFFRQTIIKDIETGKLTDLKPYKDLPYNEAQDKYDKKLTIKNPDAIVKTYPNGWKWVNAGPKCQLLGRQMKNCGSVGVMTLDPDGTIMALFDKNNKPHAMLTYSPNEKRLSGEEGGGSTAIKEKYEDYVLDLSRVLGAQIDFDKSKSGSLKLKAALEGQYQSIERLQTKNTTWISDVYFKVVMNDNTVWYTNSYTFVSEDDVVKLMPKHDNNLMSTLKFIFNTSHRVYEPQEFKQIGIYQFIKGIREPAKYQGLYQ